MPTAALADIHGNLQALDAVLADPRFTAADRVVVLGDAVTGTFPAETLDRLTALGPRARFLRGNADRLEVDGLGAVRCCHALPADDEAALTRITPEPDFAAELEGIEEAVVIGGHTHVQFDRVVGRWRYVNVGAVGRPYEGRPGAYWGLLGPDVELVRTDDDVEAAAAAVFASGQPNAEEVAETLLQPPPAEEATAHWEATRLQQ